MDGPGGDGLCKLHSRTLTTGRYFLNPATDTNRCTGVLADASRCPRDGASTAKGVRCPLAHADYLAAPEAAASAGVGAVTFDADAADLLLEVPASTAAPQAQAAQPPVPPPPAEPAHAEADLLAAKDVVPVAESSPASLPAPPVVPAVPVPATSDVSSVPSKVTPPPVAAAAAVPVPPPVQQAASAKKPTMPPPVTEVQPGGW